MKEFEIVEYQPQYGDQVKEIIYDALRSMNILGPDQVASEDSDLNNIEQTYKGRSRFWVALSKNQVIGSIALKEIDAKKGELRRMYVLPSFYGKEVAQKLLNQVLVFAQGHNYEKIILETEKVMDRAQKFYEKNGFYKMGENDGRLLFELNLVINN